MAKNDERVQKLIEAVKTRKASISKTEKATWITNGSFRCFENSTEGSFNLQTVTDEVVLAKALAFLIDREGAFKAACKRLDVKGSFVWLGYSVADWESDFKTRLAKVRISSEKKKLAALEKQLESLMSDDLKTDMKLAAIEKMLDD
jgi:hypothetical protein